jgi:PAS domain S-box-containing protein
MRSRVFKIVIFHVLGGLLWIGISDIIFLALEGGKDHPILVMGTISAICYLIVTGFILYNLINSHYRRLQESEKQYRSYFEDNPTPMWIYHRKSLRFLEVNNSAIANYGYTRDEFCKMTILDIRPPEDYKKVKAALKVFETNYKNLGTWQHKRKDGSDIYVHITSHLITSSNNERVMVMAEDITKRLQTEMHLQQANKDLIHQNNILAEIAWSESHNVRRPLASILGLINVMRNSETEEERQQCFDFIETSANELDVMIHKINSQISQAVYYD